MKRYSVTYSNFPCPREIFTILVKTNCHHSVRGVKRLLHSVTVVNVDINV